MKMTIITALLLMSSLASANKMVTQQVCDHFMTADGTKLDEVLMITSLKNDLGQVTTYLAVTSGIPGAPVSYDPLVLQSPRTGHTVTYRAIKSGIIVTYYRNLGTSLTTLTLGTLQANCEPVKQK